MPVDPSLFDAEVESLPDLIDQLNLEDKNELSQTVMSTALISYGDMNSMLHHSQSPLQSRYNRTPSHTASRKWLSPREIQKKKFRRMKNVINDQFPDSEVGEWDFDSYTQHNLDVYDVKKEELIKKTAQMANRQASIVPAYPAFGGKQFNDGRGTVLCNSTIWTHDWDNVARSAYPSKAELRYEGIERAKTNCRRCLPIPRMPASNDGVNWYMCPATEPLYWDHRYTFDIVPMHAEDIYLDYDLLVEEEGLSMLNDDLKEEMENEAEVFTSKA